MRRALQHNALVCGGKLFRLYFGPPCHAKGNLRAGIDAFQLPSCGRAMNVDGAPPVPYIAERNAVCSVPVFSTHRKNAEFTLTATDNSGYVTQAKVQWKYAADDDTKWADVTLADGAFQPSASGGTLTVDTTALEPDTNGNIMLKFTVGDAAGNVSNEISGAYALASETGTPGCVEVSFPNVPGIPDGFASLRKIIEDILPAHVGIQYVYWYVTWGELEQRFATWGAPCP